MGRPLRGGLTAAGGLVALVVGLAAIDGRVRDQIAHGVTGQGPSTQIATAGAHVQEFAATVVQAVRDQSIEHAPLVILSLVAMVLMLFLLRT